MRENPSVQLSHPSLVQNCTIYRHKKNLEGETKPRVKNQRMGPPKCCGSTASHVFAAIPGTLVPGFGMWVHPAVRTFYISLVLGKLDPVFFRFVPNF